MIIKQMTVGHMEVCCYVVGCPKTGKAALIDPAGNEDAIVSTVKSLHLETRYIINTHGHPDHTCGNTRVKALTGAQIIIHELDDDFFQRADVKDFFGRMGFPASPPADLRVKDRDIIKIGETPLNVIHVPGHTPGSICLYGDGNLFTGDTLFVGAVGRTDLPGGSLQVMLKSIKDKIIPLPDGTIVWPGHDYGDSPTSTLKEEKETNPYITDFMTV